VKSVPPYDAGGTPLITEQIADSERLHYRKRSLWLISDISRLLWFPISFSFDFRTNFLPFTSTLSGICNQKFHMCIAGFTAGPHG
jgi:hypothetical protein